MPTKTSCWRSLLPGLDAHVDHEVERRVGRWLAIGDHHGMPRAAGEREEHGGKEPDHVLILISGGEHQGEQHQSNPVADIPGLDEQQSRGDQQGPLPPPRFANQPPLQAPAKHITPMVALIVEVTTVKVSPMVSNEGS
jgi:hypothetical protein